MRRAIRWSRRHRVLGRLTGPLLDPSQPEVLSVSMLGLLLVIALWGFALVLFLSPFSDQPQNIDLAVLGWIQSLRNHIADPYMVAISQLSRLWVLVPTAMATLLWLLGAQRHSAAMHWLLAMAGGVALQLFMSWSMRATPVIADIGDERLFLPSGPMTLATVVVGFFAVMVARELRRRARKWPYFIGTLLLTLLLVSRLYLGLDWLSGALVGCVLGLAWTAIVGIAYRQRAKQPFTGWIAACIFYGTLLVTLAWQFELRREDDLAALKLPLIKREMAAGHWWREGWQELPPARTTLSSVPARFFNLQVALDPASLRDALVKQGWEAAEPAGWRWPLQALNPEPDRDSLPLTGRDYRGHVEDLVLQRAGSVEAEQWTLRLWDSGLRLTPSGNPLYLGLLAREELVQRMKLFSYWRAQPVDEAVLEALILDLPGTESRSARPGLLLIRPRATGQEAGATGVSGAAPGH
jgi:hypothetical protein